MAKYRRTFLSVGALLAATILVADAQQQPQPSVVLPMGPARERGASITPAFEGWYKNDDGSFSLLVGYYNRNAKEPLTIPIGPNNRIEPGDPDQGQPTYFEAGRQWGVFVLKVPKDFGNKAIKWTIVSNGETQSIPLTLNPGYPITPYKELGMLNEPPVLKFTADGAKFTGPPVATAATLTAAVGQPLPLTVWVSDVKERGKEDATSVATLSFHKYRGPGDVKFDPARVPAKQQNGSVASNATFSAPGEYLLRVQANDESGEGGGGFQCCWTNTYVKVTVK
jgi:hypothetical protein